MSSLTPSKGRVNRKTRTEIDRKSTSDLAAVQWLEERKAFHSRLSRTDGDLQDLIATIINDAICVFRAQRARSVTELMAAPGYHGLDLERVRVPSGDRQSRVAELLDSEAEYYLGLGGDLARLIAHEILRRADEAEQFGSYTMDEYWTDEAAWAAAVIETTEEQGGFYVEF